MKGQYTQEIESFRRNMTEAEKSEATVEKYTRDVRTFLCFCGNREIQKDLVIEYKQK